MGVHKAGLVGPTLSGSLKRNSEKLMNSSQPAYFCRPALQASCRPLAGPAWSA